MDKIIALTAAQRAEVFQAAAQQSGMSAVILEKDFWVCWTLRRLFALPDVGEHLIFKGARRCRKCGKPSRPLPLRAVSRPHEGRVWEGPGTTAAVSTPAKPEDLLDPGHFPDDLKWVPAHYKLHPTDPVYLLIAWHWRRVKQSEDTLKASIVEIKKALDDRITNLTNAAETVAGVSDALAEVQVSLDEKPAELEAQLDAKLSKPVADAVTRLQALEKSLAPLARNFQTALRRQILATFLAGVTVGVLASVIILLA